jgi:hypothetical protein
MVAELSSEEESWESREDKTDGLGTEAQNKSL